MPRLRKMSEATDLRQGDLVAETTSAYIVWKILGFRPRSWNRSTDAYDEMTVLTLEVCPHGLNAVSQIELPSSRLRKLSDMEVIALASR